MERVWRSKDPSPSWFPSSLIDRYALDHADTTKKIFPVAHEITHVLWVSLQIHGN
jgi:hypothetical protein